MGAPELTRQQADAELDRLDTERAAISSALVELDQHPGQRLLDAAPSAGATARRWAEAKDALAELHRLFEAYGQAVDLAHELRSRRDLGDLARLLSGLSIELRHETAPLHLRTLTGPTATVERTSFTAIVERMNAAFAQVTEVVAEAETIWSAVAGRLDDADEQVRAARALAGSLELGGLLETADPVLAADLDRVAAQVAALHERLASDLLSVPPDAAASLPAAAAALATRIEAVAAVRAGFTGRVAALHAELDRLRATEAEAASTRTTVLVKIDESALPTVTDRSGPLRARLTSLTALAGQWRRLAEDLPELERDVQRTIEQVRTEHEAIGSLLGRRDELRGRLDAYRAKAAGIGHSEDRELERLHEAAHQLLWTAPCDLRAATRALARYQQAVSAREGSIHG